MAEKELKIKVVLDTTQARRDLRQLNKDARALRLNAGGGGAGAGAGGGGGRARGGMSVGPGSKSFSIMNVAKKLAPFGAVLGAGAFVRSAAASTGFAYGAQNAADVGTSLASQGLRAIGEGLGLEDSEGVNYTRARIDAKKRAAESVAGMVANAPDVSDDRLRGFMDGMTRIFEPGQRNLQKLAAIRDQSIGLDEAARQLEEAGRSIARGMGVYR